MLSHKYELTKLLNKGAFGQIYKGINRITKENVIIKIENKSQNSLQHEAKLLNALRDLKGIPKMRTFGTTKEYNFIVMDELGYSLEYLKQHEKISLNAIYNIGHQLITILNDIHMVGIIHRDIKPDNILFGKQSDKLYLIDFGLSKTYIDNQWNHLPISFNKQMIGTLSFASINIHNGIESSRRDDLISLGYTLIYLFNSKLPWQSINYKNMDEKHEKIKKLKLKEFVNIPNNLKLYLKYCHELEYNDTPNYSYLLSLFSSEYYVSQTI